MIRPKVYFTKEITPESLIRIYEALGVVIKFSCAVFTRIKAGTAGNTSVGVDIDPDLSALHDGNICSESGPASDTTIAADTFVICKNKSWLSHMDSLLSGEGIIL